MSYSILNEARVKSSVADQQPVERAYSVQWLEDGNLEDWTTFIDVDIVGAWSGFLFGTKVTTAGGFVGPTSEFPPVDALTNDRIFFRMKYDKHPKNPNPTNIGKIQWVTESDPVFNDDKSINFSVMADGRWEFFELNMADAPTWVGRINKIRFFPCENGARNDEFFLNFFEIGTTNFTFSFENEKAGTPGRVVGGTPLADSIIIQKDVNDKLFVNIDDYGDVQITLTPQTATPKLIARDISLQLGKVAIGGYVRADSFVNDENKLEIESGTFAADSSVTIKFGTNSAAFDLGLTNIVGEFIGSTESGTDPSEDFRPLGSYRPTTLEILALFDNDLSLPSFTLDPGAFVLEGGRRDFSLTNRKLTSEVLQEGRSTGLEQTLITASGTFDFGAKTLIDINHPFTDDGQVTKISAHGIFDPDGGSKWKIFRPNLNGTITLIDEGSIGKITIVDDPNGGLVTSAEQAIATADVSNDNVLVRRGDYLGIFNAELHVLTTNATKVNALFYEIAGDVTGTITPPPPSGAGEAGLTIYARGDARKNRSVIDIDFGQRLNLDTITVTGEEDTRDLEYNLAIANSAVFNSDVEGQHTICFIFDFQTGARDCFDRDNVNFNLQALNDNILLAENNVTSFGDGGIGGEAGADVSGATYFYSNGDAEFLGLLEFQGVSPKSYGFFRDRVGIDCFFTQLTGGLDKPVGKVVMFFKDRKNQRSFQLEFQESISLRGGNGSKSGFSLIPEDTITKIKFDDHEVLPVDNFVTLKVGSDLGNVFLKNPVLLEPIANGIRSPQRGVDYVESLAEIGGLDNFGEQQTFIALQWTRFEWNFEALRMHALRWSSDFHWSTKISEMQVFGVSESKESLGDNVQVLFSEDGENFFIADVLNATETTSEHKVGNSPQFLRLVIRPTLQLSLSEIGVEFEEDQICFGTEGRLGNSTSVEDARVGSVGASQPLIITNNMGEEANLSVDIAADIQSAQQLLYFSKLQSANDITQPQVGPPGRVDFVSDKVLKEEENIAINATAYGLLNLTGDTDGTLESDELLTNTGFETGNLTSWDLEVVQSGSQVFQIPQVFIASSGTREEIAALVDFQDGEFIFGYSIDEQIPFTTLSGVGLFTPIEFTLAQDIDASEFADSLDTGASILRVNFRYVYTSEAVDPGPVVRLIGAPTASGIAEPAGTIISSTYGSNLLRTLNVPKSGTFLIDNAEREAQLEFPVKRETRFLRLEIEGDSNDGILSGNTGGGGSTKRQKFLLDDVSAKLTLPDSSVNWYKSWRTGLIPTGPLFSELDGWTDTRFEDIKTFVVTTGTHHWWQPFKVAASAGIPIVGQTQGFSNAFLGDRKKGVQSFARMTSGDPGELGAQWVDERKIVGFRIAFAHEPTLSSLQEAQYPRIFTVRALKTKAELGVDPDINNELHFKNIRVYKDLGTFDTPTTIDGVDANFEAPFSEITTWLFSEPITTEGIKLVFTINCDKFERDAHADFATFTAFSTCPQNRGTPDFVSSYGLSVSFFVPLEAIGHTDLPVDNVKEQIETGNIFVAADLGRRHAIDTSTDLLELIAGTVGQTEFNSASTSFSGDNTSDPNSVIWAGSSSNARWIRWSSVSEDAFEEVVETSEGTNDPAPVNMAILSRPQAILSSARVYPLLTTTLIPTEGYNSSFENLGNILTDNRGTTSIFYSDFPVVVFDFGKQYFINQESTQFKNIHTVIRGILEDGNDVLQWDDDGEANFTYAATPSAGSANPQHIPFLPFGTSVPDYSLRWAAIKGGSKLQHSVAGPKLYNIRTNGQRLIQINFRPRSPLVLSENSNWFITTRAVLKDISTVDFTLGKIFSVADGVDFGSSSGANEDGLGDNIGPAFNAFDGSYNVDQQDVWGVSLRDSSRQPNVEDDFPHNIFRVFRDTYRGAIEKKSVRAIKIVGHSELFHPKDFKFQKLKDQGGTVGSNPTVASNWVDIDGASFTGVDTFQETAGFIHFFSEPIATAGIRISISDSEFPDDSIIADQDPDASNVLPPTTQGSFAATGDTDSNRLDVSGPQTKVQSITIYDEEVTSLPLTGTIDINQITTAALTSTTAVPDQLVTNLQDLNISTFWQSTDVTGTVTIVFPKKVPISVFEWEQDENLGFNSGNLSTGAPLNFNLKAVIDAVDTLIFTETDFIGTSFRKELPGGPIISDTFKFEITEVQGLDEDASSIIISELRLIEQQEQVTSLITVEEAFDRRPGSTNNRSTLITYAANSSASATVVADGLDMGNDEFFSERDFFSFWIKINDVSLLDTSFGSIKIGNDQETVYEWNLNSISLGSGWNQIRLQFKDAPNKTGIPVETGPKFNPDAGESQVDFITEDIELITAVDGTSSARIVEAPGIRYFQITFKGTGGASPLELTLDDFRFERNRFDDVVKFGKGLYLNNSELLTLNLNGLDLFTGTIEFWFTPDWDDIAKIGKDNVITPGIFRIVRPDNKYMNLFYRPGQGFVCLISDGKVVNQYVSNRKLHRFNKFDVFHFALVLDVRGQVGPEKATVAMYFNGESIYGNNEPWDVARESGSSIMVGGEVGQKFSANPHNATALTFLAVPTLPTSNTASMWGVLENLKIYNYAKTDFSDIFDADLERTQLVTPSELVEISLDDVNFHGVGSQGLPLVQNNVAQGEDVTVYIRTNIPKNLSRDVSRDASLLIRWKTPLADCE